MVEKSQTASLSDKIDELHEFAFNNSDNPTAIIKKLEKDVREFIRQRELRLRNQLRIHWRRLQIGTKQDAIDFVVAVANAGAGPKLCQKPK